MKTLDINAKEWFDKVNGNSYFSADVTVDLGIDTEKNFVIPFQYGYGEHYRDAAFSLIKKELNIKTDDCLWRYCRDNNIILRSSKQENCLKRDLAKV